MHYYIVNGELVPKDDASLHVSDLGLLRGYGLFDFFRVKAGVPLFAEDYLDRFYRSAALLSITPPVSREALTSLVHKLIEVNNAPDAAIKLLLTGGYAEDGFTPGEPNLVMLEQSFTPPGPAQVAAGIALMSYPYVRDIPEAKTTNYTKVISLLPRLKAEDAQDVLWHDGQHISESSRSNVFVLGQDGVLRTPVKNALMGITRKQVLVLAREVVEVSEGDVTLNEARTAREVFMTSSTKGVLAVTRLDGEVIGEGTLGSLSRELMVRFAQHVDAYVAAQREGVAR